METMVGCQNWAEIVLLLPPPPPPPPRRPPRRPTMVFQNGNETNRTTKENSPFHTQVPMISMIGRVDPKV
jgi:hypothetical protein